MFSYDVPTALGLLLSHECYPYSRPDGTLSLAVQNNDIKAQVALLICKALLIQGLMETRYQPHGTKHPENYGLLETKYR
ncbi:MAG: hypothetical protein DWQ02_15655 [Bacteroidetes bacterium]|nr:MAG: hypothetical protein DWQ02_15655 [Bacteroidota bacterium]